MLQLDLALPSRSRRSTEIRYFAHHRNRHDKSELSQNPVLTEWSIQDLNEDPDVKLVQDGSEVKLDASTCVVSVDYLTKPVEVLQSIRRQTNDGGKVHLGTSNRWFPTKVVGRWLEVSEDERLDMVGDYQW